MNAVAGSVAGGLAAGITTPFDVIKTQLQTTKNLGQSQETMLTSASRWVAAWLVAESMEFCPIVFAFHFAILHCDVWQPVHVHSVVQQQY